MSLTVPGLSRRAFLRAGAMAGGALAVTKLSPVFAQSAPAASIGLALYTVRDLMEHDFEGVLAKVAAIGYQEVETANGFNNMSPKAFRAMLDKYKLKCVSTHTTPVLGTDLEKQWEGFQTMGIQYSREPAPPRPPRAPGVSLGQYMNRNSFLEVEAFGPLQPRLKIEAAQRRAASINEQAKLASKFGIKLFIHNHTGEFERLLDSPKTEMDIYLEETDPALVTLQLDLGWTRIAGVDPLELFKKNPGRYELWHIKDVVGLKTVNPTLSPNERTSSMAFTPVGRGQIDWRPYFAQAELAGMKHFFVEQDNASTFGDSLAAARVSYESLKKIRS